jgi:hypothetical protein
MSKLVDWDADERGWTRNQRFKGTGLSCHCEEASKAFFAFDADVAIFKPAGKDALLPARRLPRALSSTKGVLESGSQ